MLTANTENLGSVTVLHFRGSIVVGDALTTLCSAVLAQSGASVVVLDLAQVDVIDAGGLGALLELRECVQSRGIEFRLTNVNRLVKHVLEITCLESVFEVRSGGGVASAFANAGCSGKTKAMPAVWIDG